MDHPVEPTAAREQPRASAALIVRPSMALARRVGERVQRWILPLPLARIKGGLRHWRDALLRNPLADELERTRRDNEQLQALLEELPEIFERKYQQRLEPLLEHQYRLLEDNALLMDQLRQLQGADAAAAAPQLLPAAAPGLGDRSDGGPEAKAPEAPGAGWGEQAAGSEAFAEVSVHLDGAAPALPDVTSLLISPPWGAPAPVVLESMQSQVHEPAETPVQEPQADQVVPAQTAEAGVSLASPSAEPSFEELVSMATQQLQGEPMAEAPWAAEAAAFPPMPAPEPAWLPTAGEREASPAGDWRQNAMEPAPAPAPEVAAEPVPMPAVAAPALPAPPLPAPEAPAPVVRAEPSSDSDFQDLDPLERARARRLQAWRRARQQGEA